MQNGNLEIKQIDLDEFLSPKNGSDAGYAILIGNAEGNRRADGSKTPNYYGHRDPGDGYLMLDANIKKKLVKLLK